MAAEQGAVNRLAVHGEALTQLAVTSWITISVAKRHFKTKLMRLVDKARNKFSEQFLFVT